MFISIRIWILANILFTIQFLETKVTNPGLHRFIVYTLIISLGLPTIYQFAFPSTSISYLHVTENIIGFIWIILALTIVGVAFKQRKLKSTYYLIAYSSLLVFVCLGLIDSHTTLLPGDPFSYFKIGSALEFIGFTYFITVLVKNKLIVSEDLEHKLLKHQLELAEKNKQLKASENSKIELVSIFKLLENSLSEDDDWEEFKLKFQQLSPNFLDQLVMRHGDLSKSEIRLLTLIRIGYSQKEIASILSIAPDSVKKARSRVRKRLNLTESEKLNAYLE